MYSNSNVKTFFENYKIVIKIIFLIWLICYFIYNQRWAFIFNQLHYESTKYSF